MSVLKEWNGTAWVPVGTAWGGGGAGDGGVDADAVNALIATATTDFEARPTLNSFGQIAAIPPCDGMVYGNVGGTGGYYVDEGYGYLVDGIFYWISGWTGSSFINSDIENLPEGAAESFNSTSDYFPKILRINVADNTFLDPVAIPAPAGAPVRNAPVGVPPDSIQDGIYETAWQDVHGWPDIHVQIFQVAWRRSYADVVLPHLPGKRAWLFNLPNGALPASASIASFASASVPTYGGEVRSTESGVHVAGASGYLLVVETDDETPVLWTDLVDIDPAMLASFPNQSYYPASHVGYGSLATDQGCLGLGFEGGYFAHIGGRIYFGGGDSNLYDEGHIHSPAGVTALEATVDSPAWTVTDIGVIHDGAYTSGRIDTAGFMAEIGTVTLALGDALYFLMPDGIGSPTTYSIVLSPSSDPAGLTAYFVAVDAVDGIITFTVPDHWTVGEMHVIALAQFDTEPIPTPLVVQRRVIDLGVDVDADGNRPWSPDTGRWLMSYDIESGTFDTHATKPNGVDYSGFHGTADDKLWVLTQTNSGWVMDTFDPGVGEVGAWFSTDVSDVIAAVLMPDGETLWTDANNGADWAPGQLIGRKLVWLSENGLRYDVDTGTFDAMAADPESNGIVQGGEWSTDSPLAPDGTYWLLSGGSSNQTWPWVRPTVIRRYDPTGTPPDGWAGAGAWSNGPFSIFNNPGNYYAYLAGWFHDGMLRIFGASAGIGGAASVRLDFDTTPHIEPIVFADEQGTPIARLAWDATVDNGSFQRQVPDGGGGWTSTEIGGGPEGDAISSLTFWIQSGGIPSSFGDGTALISADNIGAGTTSGRHILNDRTLSGALNDADAALFALQNGGAGTTPSFFVIKCNDTPFQIDDAPAGSLDFTDPTTYDTTWASNNPELVGEVHDHGILLASPGLYCVSLDARVIFGVDRVGDPRESGLRLHTDNTAGVFNRFPQYVEETFQGPDGHLTVAGQIIFGALYPMLISFQLGQWSEPLPLTTVQGWIHLMKIS